MRIGGKRSFVHADNEGRLSAAVGNACYGGNVVGSGHFTGTMVRGKMILPEKPFTAAPVIVVMLIFQIVMLGIRAVFDRYESRGIPISADL